MCRKERGMGSNTKSDLKVDVTEKKLIVVPNRCFRSETALSFKVNENCDRSVRKSAYSIKSTITSCAIPLTQELQDNVSAQSMEQFNRWIISSKA